MLRSHKRKGFFIFPALLQLTCASLPARAGLLGVMSVTDLHTFHTESFSLTSPCLLWSARPMIRRDYTCSPWSH